MKVLLLTSIRLPPEEGLGQYVWNLARFLVRAGNHVEIITRGGAGGLQVEERQGIRIWKPSYLPVYPVHVWLHSLFAQRLVARVEAHFDVLHVHTPLPACVRTSLPVVLTVHAPMRAGVGAIPIRDALAALYHLQLPFSAMIERFWLARGDCISAVSTSVANELNAYGVPRQSVVVVGNGVDTVTFNVTAAPVRHGSLLFAASRLGHGKGLEDLLAAASFLHAQNVPFQLRIAGKGPLEGRLRGLIRRLRLCHEVQLLGHIRSRKEMARLYSESTIFVHAAHYEGLPTVLLEAMACGCAVVSTAVSGALDVIAEGVNGMLVPPRDPGALAGAILELLQNRSLAERLGSAARRTVQERFSWPTVASRYVEIYQQVLREFAG